MTTKIQSKINPPGSPQLASKEEMSLPPDKLLDMYRKMMRIRLFEQAAFDLYTAGKLPGFMHISIGQEATSVGACAPLRGDDYMTSTHRGHGDTLAKGVSVEAAITELFGKVGGACRAKGGSMHIADFRQGILGANGIVAAGFPIAVGAGLSIKYQNTDQVVVCFFGDGATMSGPAHESLNAATLWNLPVIFVRQNNQYAESTPARDYQGIPDIIEWARSYGMPAEKVDGNNVLEVYHAVNRAVERARARMGPSFIESMTYRWYGHNIGDPGLGRPKEEVKAWKERDPIPFYRNILIQHGIAIENELDQIDTEEKERLEVAIKMAEAAPKPAVTEALEDVYDDRELGTKAIRGVRL